MIDTNVGLTQGEFQMLLGQLWHHYERGEKDRASSFLALLEVCQSEGQTHQMVDLLDEEVYDELMDRAQAISQRLQALRLDANTLTLVRVVRDNVGQILHMEQFFRFIAENVEGLAALLDQADSALTQDVLEADEELEQLKRYGLGRTGWDSLHSHAQSMARAVPPSERQTARQADWLHSHAQSMARAVPPVAAAAPTVAATDVLDTKDAGSEGDVSSLHMLLELLDEAFAADRTPALCLEDWLLELEPEEEQLVWERYPQTWLESIMEATEEDRTEMRVLRRGDADNPWLHLTDCTFTRQDNLMGYVDDTFYMPHIEAMAAYLRDCRQALQLPIVDAFDFDN